MGTDDFTTEETEDTELDAVFELIGAALLTCIALIS